MTGSGDKMVIWEDNVFALTKLTVQGMQKRGHCAVPWSAVWWGILWNTGAQSWSPVPGGQWRTSRRVWNLSCSLGEEEGEGVLGGGSGGAQDHGGYLGHITCY